MTSDFSHLNAKLNLYDRDLQPIPSSPWIGVTATGPHRRQGTVHRVYPTPHGAEVAVLTHGTSFRTWIELEVTELLSAPGLPAAHRAEYLANHRALMKIAGRIVDGDRSPRLLAAQQRRIDRFLHYKKAIDFVRASLIEQITPGDHAMWGNTRVVVTDPDLKRGVFGERQWMRAQVVPEQRTTVDCAQDGTADVPVVGLFPTLDLA